MYSSQFRKFALSAFALLLPLGGAAAQEKPWVVGEVVPLTGPAATIGVPLDRPVAMWAEKVNAEGGINGRKIDLHVCDDGYQPQRSIACTRDMIDQGAAIILGLTLTASLQAMMPLVQNGPILINASPGVVPKADSYAFLVSPTEDSLLQGVADFAKANGIKKIGMIAATDASGEYVSGVATRIIATENNIELKIARIDLKAMDASTQLASIASDDVGLIYSVYSGGGAATVVKSYHNLGLKQPLMVSYANVSGAFANLVKDVKPARLFGVAVAAIVPEALKNPSERERALAFMAAYEKKYSARADMVNILGQSVADVADAILRKSPNPADFSATKKWLETHPVESALDQTYSSTSHVGVGSSHVAIVELKGDTWVPATLLK